MDIAATDLLQQYDINSLQQMARTHDLKLSGSRKDTYTTALASRIYDPAWIKRALEQLSAAERALLDRVMLSDGDVPTTLVRNQLEG